MIDLLRELPQKAKKAPGIFKVQRWATPEEGMVLYTLIQAHEIQSYLECGTANGYTALWAAHAFNGRDRTFIHTWDIVDRPKVWAHHPQFADLGARIRCHMKPFDEGVAHVLAPGPKLFFIDGEHERSAVRKDLRAVRMLLQPGDVMVFHDAREAPVLELCQNLRLIHGYRGGIVRTARSMGVYFA